MLFDQSIKLSLHLSIDIQSKSSIMKKAIQLLTLGLFILVHSSVFAQQEPRKQPSPEARAKRQAAEMKVRLNLDDAQTSKVYDILLTKEKEMSQKRDQARQRRLTHLNKIETLLNEDQKREFTKMQEEKRERTKARRHINSTPQKENSTPKNE